MLSTHSMFRRRWFVLHENTLFWYKSSIEVSAGLPPQGIILLSSAYEVRARNINVYTLMCFILFYSIFIAHLFSFFLTYLFIYLPFYFFQVRESVDPDAPENSIDIVTNAKVEQYPI